MSSPTVRSLKLLRDEGYLCQVVERFNHFSKTRLDLFGFIDILAIRENEVLGVQATSRSNVSSRVAKITEHENTAAVRKSGIRIEVWGWGKLKDGWCVKRVDLS